MPTRNDIVTAARSYVDTRFKLHGRTHLGIDCVGLLLAVANDVGQETEDSTTYNMGNPFALDLNAHLQKQTSSAPKMPIKNGQIAKFRQSILPMHVGIITMDTGRITVIHASIKKKRVVEEPFDTRTSNSSWRNLLLELREFKGVTD